MSFYAHEVLGLLPLLDLQSVVEGMALRVLLRGAEGGQRQLVAVIDALRDVDEPVVAFEVGSLDVTVAPALRAEYRQCPAALREARREAERKAVKAIVTYAERERAALLGLDAVGHDVDRTADRGRRDFRGAQAALGLHAARHVREAGPVRPVYAAPLHIVHGDAVDQHLASAEPDVAEPDLAAARFGDLPVIVAQGQHEGVERRVLGAPFFGCRDALLHQCEVDVVALRVSLRQDFFDR